MAFGLDIALQPAPALAWRTLADSVGGAFEPGDFWTPDRLVLVSAPWMLALSKTSVAAPLAAFGPAFHATSRITASDPALAREVFSSPALRRQLVAEPHLALDLSSGTLRLALSGHIDDKGRLVRLLATTAELLQRLSDLGVASPP